MPFRKARNAAPQEPFTKTHPVKDLPRAGSLGLRAAAYIAAILLIAVTAATNIAHAWQAGLPQSTFHAAVLAAGSLGSALAAPVALAAAFEAARRWRLGSAAVALTLGLLALAYNSVSTTGFLGTTRDTAAAERSAVVDAGADRRARFAAAAKELGALKGQGSSILKRRRELEKTMRETAAPMGLLNRTPVTVRTVDPQAANLAAYASAIGFQVDAATLAPWLALWSTLFFELGAALSLVTARALGHEKQAHPENSSAETGYENASLTTNFVTPPAQSRKRGRPSLNGKPMSPAERQSRHRNPTISGKLN